MQAKKATSAASLNPKEVETMLASPETFSQFLSDQSEEQIRTMIDGFKNTDMDENVRSALMAILQLALQESKNNAAEIQKILEPKIKHLALCLELNRQINELEQLNASL